jgi:ubiquinone biosynthesis protein
VDLIRLLIDTVAFVLIPVAVIAFVAGRLLGTRHSLGTSFTVALVGYLIGVAAAVGPDLETSADVSRLDVFEYSLVATMLLLTALELLRGSGPRHQQGWIRWWRRAARRVAALRRSWEVVGIARRNGFGPALWLVPGRRKKLDGTMPERLRRTIEESGGTMVKLGQVASTREDVLPPEYAVELAKLRTTVEPAPTEAIAQMLTDELGRPVDAVFAEFDWTPVGSASIAQVHLATLRTGEHVVVKVQRPDVAETVQRDVRALRELARFVDDRANSSVGTQLASFVQEFGANLIEELDFRAEASNAADIAAAVAGEEGIAVPSVYSAYTTERVMVQERVDGVPVGQLDELADIDRAQIADRVFRSFFHQAFEAGVFHGDPHPGNIFVRADGTVYLIDFGAVGRLDPYLLDGLRRMLIAAGAGDPGALTAAVIDVVGGVDPELEDDLERALSRFLSRSARHRGAGGGAGGGGGVGPQALVEMLRVMGSFGLDIPSELSLLGRSLVTIDGTLRLIDPGFSMSRAAGAVAAEWRSDVVESGDLESIAQDELIKQLPTLRTIPRDLQRSLRASTGGGLAIRLSWLQSPEDQKVLAGLLNRIAIAVFAPLLLIGSVALLYVGELETGDDAGYLEVIGNVGIFLSGILLLRLVIAIARDGLGVGDD